MSNRVTGAEVKEIITIDTETIPSLEPFITMANLIVTNTLGSEGLSADLLKEIERNMTAHMACAADPRVSEEDIDGMLRVKYNDGKKFGDGLQETPYGRNVLLLDPTGKMAKIAGKKASLGIIQYEDGYE